MASVDTRPHVYQRSIIAGDFNSLSAIVAQLPSGARVLDLGCGSGAIGRHLVERDGAAHIDGVTLSDEEAALAAPWYRRVVVANLEHQPLAELFKEGNYDFIICADVLEHLRGSAAVLGACRQLLATNGRLLLSVPNAAYCGLIAELMAGEFRYRPEGLLDETHLRFFTRQSLQRFLANNGWLALQLHTVTRELPDSEFRVAFDALPPAVARYLLVLPDALTYQFIVAARPLQPGEEAPQPTAGTRDLLPAQALFTAELFFKQPGGYDEAHKCSVAGVIGEARQTLRFDVPVSAAPAGLKLDPADRPGFLHLYAMRLLGADGSLLWHWHGLAADVLAQAPSQQIALRPPATPHAPCVLLMHGDDPWIDLPVPGATLAASAGGAFEIDLGWPMSADYLALADIAGELAQARQGSDLLQQELERLHGQYQHDLAVRDSEHQNTLEALRVQSAQQLMQVEQLRLRSQQLQARGYALVAEVTAAARARDKADHQRARAEQHIEFLTNSTVFRATRPLVQAKIALDRVLCHDTRPDTSSALDDSPKPLAPTDHPVDIIVPVYRGLEDTRRCLLSVLGAQCRTSWRLIVINDASPEPEVTQWLRDLAAGESRIELLENEHNLGFVGTVNRGMALSSTNDVLLLNSDTEVANDWLDRIRAAAYGDQKVASVTPFSNNATICSYPRFCEDNDLPAGWDTARLDALFARTNPGQVVDVPTGVGFCMYIRRAALDAAGLFDVENFGKGYGEENDFCVRAANAGWRNLHVLDTFVRHFGGVSFGDSKSPRERAAMETLRRLHPRYEAEVMRFVQADPARPARLAADLARVYEGEPRPVILAVLHDRQGGTERHAAELAATLQGKARFFVLRPHPGHAVQLRLPEADEGFELVFKLPDDYPRLLNVLRTLGVQHVHFHHLLGQGELVRQLPERLGVTFDFSAHDFYTLCPQISLTDRSNGYCGELGVAQCTACLAHSPAPGGVDIITWRQHHIQFLQQARYVLAPGSDVLARIAPLAPEGRLRLVPHTDIDSTQALPVPQPAPLQEDRPLKIVVIGALSIIKGADVLEDVALLAAKRGAPLDFHLIGYGYRALRTRPRSHLTVHGKYIEKDLPALLEWLKPDLLWFPAQWPETYSYTLSAALQGGWPVVAPDIGAFSERLSGRRWSWVRPWNESAADWLAFFLDVRQRHFATGEAPPLRMRLQTEASRKLPAGVATQSPHWYSAEYLADIPPAAGPGSDVRELLEPFMAADASAAATGAKSVALNALVRLRAMPVLSWVARAIPLRWQTRVKTWLRN